MLAPRALAVALSFVLAPDLAADVLRVQNGDPSSYPSIQAAVDAAAEGDVILVGTGTYTPFTVTGKSLTIEFERPEQAILAWGDYVVEGLAPAQRFTLRGARATLALRLRDNAGEVWIEATRFGAGAAPPLGTDPLEITACDSVVLVGCQFGVYLGIPEWSVIPGPAARIERSDVVAYATSFRGRGFPGNSEPGGDGAILTSSQLYASGCLFAGGDGGSPPCGFSCQPPSSGGYPGGSGVVLTGSSLVARDCSFVAGIGYSASDGDEVEADATSSWSTLFGVARHARTASVVPTSGTVETTVTGLPHDWTWLIETVDPVQLAIASPYVGRVWFAPGFRLVALGQLDAAGQGSFAFSAPPLAPELDALVLTYQPLYLDATNALVSVGGPSRTVPLGP